MEGFYSGHARHLVSVDCIIFGFDEGKLKLLLGQRKMDPGRGEWSLYGGFVEEDEDVHTAAERVLFSLTGLEGISMFQLHAFGMQGRDPGARVISVAYYALIKVNDYYAVSLRDQGQEWVGVNNLPRLYADHNEMVSRALEELRLHAWTQPVCFDLLPEEFTLTQLQTVFEAVLDKPLDKRNFRKRMEASGMICPTGRIDKKTSRRGAALYQFDRTKFEETLKHQR